MKDTYTADQYLWFDEELVYENVLAGIWDLTTFKEWHSVVVAECVKNSTNYLQTTIKMMEDSESNN